MQAELKQGVDTIYSNDCAVAAKMRDGSVDRGDSSTVQGKLKQGVDTIYSTGFAFAAKMRDGSVITWGDPEYGSNTCKGKGLAKPRLC